MGLYTTEEEEVEYFPALICVGRRVWCIRRIKFFTRPVESWKKKGGKRERVALYRRLAAVGGVCRASLAPFRTGTFVRPISHQLHLTYP